MFSFFSALSLFCAPVLLLAQGQVNSLDETHNKLRCGLRFGIPSNTINDEPYDTRKSVNGFHAAKPGDFPWQGFLQVMHGFWTHKKVPKFGGEWRPYCGATVINEEWVLTTAFCVHFLAEPVQKGVIVQTSVLVGTTSTSNKDGYGTRHRIIDEIRHPQFNKYTKGHNLALLRVSPPIVFNTGSAFGEGAVNPICLPTDDLNFEGTVTVPGWTKHNDVGGALDRLKAADYEIRPNSECQNTFKKFFSPAYKFCANRKGSSGICTGDAGAAMVQIIDDKAYAVGLLSEAENMCNGPAQFMRLAHYAKWIYSTIAYY